MKHKKPAGADPPPQPERRSGKERRVAPPNTPVAVERRRGIEPRRPEIVELDMSPSEWGSLQDAFKKPD
ncbi:MAG: hypothetical protein ABW005_04470 [Burkholderiaceae bacterium]